VDAVHPSIHRPTIDHPFTHHPSMYDVVIIGGGPAGLNAALVLGRCRRHVLVCDDGHPRNARARAVHGYLTRDGVPPLELLRLGREELVPYGIEWVEGTATAVSRTADGFTVALSSGDRIGTRTVLLATGVSDDVPDIAGLDACYGISVHHCPYCDGWEVRDRAIVALGEQMSPAGLALSLKTWTSRVIACTNGRARVTRVHRRQLASHDIPLHEGAITRVEHDGGQLRRVVFANGSSLDCEALFFTAPQRQQCELARVLGCEFTRKGTVKTDHLGQTCVPGIYVVGDASRDVQFAIVAAAEGAKAGVAINHALQEHSGLAAQRMAS
jgi:thioredoxin reductase